MTSTSPVLVNLVPVATRTMVTPCPLTVHPGDHLLIDGEEIVVDSELTAGVENGAAFWDFDRHTLERDEVRLRGGSDRYGVTRLRIDQPVTVCRRGAR